MATLLGNWKTANTVAIFKIALKTDPQKRNLKKLNSLMGKIVGKII